MVQIRIIEFATPEYDLSVQLRTEVLRAPLGLEFNVSDFDGESIDIHLGCFNNKNQLLGCMVLTKVNESSIKMRQVAVVQKIQHQGIGKAMVNAAELYVLGLGYSRIVLNARDVSVPFYKKLNYKLHGNSFIEVGITHTKMFKVLG